jgi:hypothetical protein
VTAFQAASNHSSGGFPTRSALMRENCTERPISPFVPHRPRRIAKGLRRQRTAGLLLRAGNRSGYFR